MTDTNEPIETSATPIETTNPNDEKTTNVDTQPPKKRKKSNAQEPIKITAAPQPTPPPLMSYPHLVPSYYPVYQHPYFLAVGPQPPISPSLSPTLTSTSSNTTASKAKSAANVRILPKSPTSTPTTTPMTPPSALQPSYIYPYAIQVSPQLHPSVPPSSGFPPTVRHNSLTSTADEREQARKVSHSAIERRRRERINDKILQLRDLIPACSDRENLHKMTILQSAIDYIVYLKKVIHDLEGDSAKFIPNVQQQQTKSLLPKEVEPFTHQFSVKDDDDDGTWSPAASPTLVPSSGLKPMDVIQLGKSKKAGSPPKIIVAPAESNTNSNPDRNMNLENILC